MPLFPRSCFILGYINPKNSDKKHYLCNGNTPIIHNNNEGLFKFKSCFVKKFFLEIIFFSLAILVKPPFVFSQDSGQKIKAAEDLVKPHIERVIEQGKANQEYGRQVAEQIQGGTLRHPWTESGNPTSGMDWQLDSFFAKDFNPINGANWNNIHGCFQFGLLGQSNTSDFGDFKTTSFEPALCQLNCMLASMFTAEGWPHRPHWWFPLLPPPPQNNNGMETAMYWFPEYEVYTNNYGINRLRPEDQGQTLFSRQALTSQKASFDQQKATAAGQTYPYDASGFQVPPHLKNQPYFGQGQWGGFAFPDFEDKLYAHIARTHFSVTRSDLRKNTILGWGQPNPGQTYSRFDSFPPKSSEHAPINIWTEYGMWDLYTSIPHFSTRLYGGIGAGLMNALFGGRTANLMQAAKEQNPFWKNSGAMAYRVQKWPDMYGSLRNLYNIGGGADPKLAEVVYKGGHELYPVVTNLSGFGSPTLSTAAIIARRGLYIAGENQTMLPFYPTNVPNPRIMQYTINLGNKSQEIDKMQLIFPRRGSALTSECFRSQNIPNLTTNDAGLKTWAETNFPADLTKFALDPALASIQGGDTSFIYWNRRISCHCKFAGIPTGSWVMDKGDKLYDIPKFPLCSYLPTYGFSAWQGEDTYRYCIPGPGDFLRYRGMNDLL